MMPKQPGESRITQNNAVIEDQWDGVWCRGWWWWWLKGGRGVFSLPVWLFHGPGHLTDVHWPEDPTAEAFSPTGMDVTSFIQLGPRIPHLPPPASDHSTCMHKWSHTHTHKITQCICVFLCFPPRLRHLCMVSSHHDSQTDHGLSLKGHLTHNMLCRGLTKESNAGEGRGGRL